MRIAVCDDERAEVETIVAAIRRGHPDRKPETFTNGVSLLAAAKETPGFGVAFLDIYMGGENGVDIARELRVICPDISVVFVTTSREHAVEAFSLHALHYLVKPVTPEAVEEVFKRLDARAAKERPILALQSGQTRGSLYQDEIRYLQSADHSTQMLLEDGSVCRARQPIGELAKLLDERFLQVQRGVIVNMLYIAQMNVEDCVLRNGVTFKLSRKDKFAIRAAYNNYIFGQLSQGGQQEQLANITGMDSREIFRPPLGPEAAARSGATSRPSGKAEAEKIREDVPLDEQVALESEETP